MQKLTLFACAVCCATLLPAQRSATWTVVYLNNTPRLDGQLNDSCWQTLAALPAFTTSTPVFGQAAHGHTEVRLFYSDDALWVSAYCHTAAGGHIRDDRSARDGVAGADWFQLSLDTWNDDQHAFDFTVSAAGIQSDDNGSVEWNAVWQSAVSLQSDGWTVEIRIPYTALRFPRKSEQVWGLQLTRYERSSGELSTWSPQNPAITDQIWQFGTLTGIRDIQQARRRGTAFHAGADYHQVTYNLRKPNSIWLLGGVDQQFGLNESTTLDFSLLPPLGIDLAAGDNYPDKRRLIGNVKFSEPRQLEAEASDLFERGIGVESTPVLSGYDLFWRDTSINFRWQSFNSNLLQSTKFTTRGAGNWRIGVYNALLGPAGGTAIFVDSIKKTLQTVSAYNYLSAEYLLPNTGFINFSNSTFLAGQGLWSLKPTLDWRLRDRQNAYEFSGSTRLSIQRFDTTTQAGGALQLRLARVNRRWGWQIEHRGQGTTYQPYLVADPHRLYYGPPQTSASVLYNRFEPLGPFLNFRGTAGASVQWPWFDSDKQRWSLETSFTGLDRHFRQSALTLWVQPYETVRTYGIGSLDIKQNISPQFGGSLSYSSDERKRIFWSGQVAGSSSIRGEIPYVSATLAQNWAPTHSWILNLQTQMIVYYNILQPFYDPNRLLFRRWDEQYQHISLQVAWQPLKELQFTAQASFNRSKPAHQEVVELDEHSHLVPVNYDVELQESQKYFTGILGVAYYFKHISMLSIQQTFNPNDQLVVRERPRGYEFSNSGQTQIRLVYWLDWSGKTAGPLQ